ncbi:MAG: hypothetical protein M3065_08375 [Actinomycetota bacterium]|nr:hypothetical protein [Actinomycetota bacterium]
MGMLAETVDHVIGVDTHRDTHTAAIVAAGTGAEGQAREFRADASGYRQLLRFAEHHAGGSAGVGDRVQRQLRRRARRVPVGAW